MKKIKFSKKIFLKIFVGVFVFLILVFTLFNTANVLATEAVLNGVSVVDVGVEAATKEVEGKVEGGTWDNMKNWATSFWKWTSRSENDTMAAIAFKTALGTFLD
ncbi:MAG: hypothetical protein U9M94_00380, partial [Patescibacteria group bacterium]|nr:hypothetical protein [Patescibacteria group bacterium]